jgi:hypothetical protein
MKEAIMFISVSSAHRVVGGAVGAGIVAGGLLFGAPGTAQAAPAPASGPGAISTAVPAYLHNQSDVNPVVTTGWENAPMPDWWHHRWFHPWWWWW